MRTAQKKRQFLREQWLSETAPAPRLTSFDSSRPRLSLQAEADERTARQQTKSQKTPEDEDIEEAADARKEEQASQEESVDCAAAARTQDHDQAGTDEDERVNKEADLSRQMAQRMFHESGQDGRSVLGTLAVQVERDPRTGATVVRSVAPVSTPAGAPTATTVFDDGRKSIHAVGGVGGQPSTEELGQILSAIDGVGMKALLDEVAVTPNKAETKMEHVETSRAPEGKALSFSARHGVSGEDNMQLDSFTSYSLEVEPWKEDCVASMGNKQDQKTGQDRSIMALRDIAGEVDNVEEKSLEEGPVTLLFLGYTDATTEGRDREDHEGMITVERVMITDDGEEHVIGPETPAKDQVFQDVPLEGNGAAGVQVQGEEGEKGLHDSSDPSAPRTAEAGGTKRKTCQCCSVM